MEFTLREWTMEDAPALAEAANNQKIQQNLRDGLPYPYAVSDAEAFIRGVLDAPAESQYVWAIAVDGVAAGCVGVYRGQNIHRLTAELGYYVAEPYWGRGLAGLAVREACRRVFTRTDIVRVFAEPFAHNAASCRVLEKAGFTLEGVLRRNAVKNGEILDMRLYALLREDAPG